LFNRTKKDRGHGQIWEKKEKKASFLVSVLRFIIALRSDIFKCKRRVKGGEKEGKRRGKNGNRRWRLPEE